MWFGTVLLWDIYKDFSNVWYSTEYRVEWCPSGLPDKAWYLVNQRINTALLFINLLAIPKTFYLEDGTPHCTVRKITFTPKKEGSHIFLWNNTFIGLSHRL